MARGRSKGDERKPRDKAVFEPLKDSPSELIVALNLRRMSALMARLGMGQA